MTRTYATTNSGGGGGGGGYTIEIPSGSLYDQNTGTGGLVFTVTVTPVYIVADSGTYFNNAGYTLSGLTVTMSNPVTQYIRSFHL